MILAFTTSVGLRVIRLTLGLLASALLFRHLGKEGLGQLFLAMSTVSVVQCLTELGLGRITVRELVKQPGALGSILGTTFTARGIAGVLGYLVVVCVALFQQGDAMLLLLIYGLLLVSNSVSEVNSAMESQGRTSAIIWIQFVASLFTPAAFAYLVVAGKGVEWFAAAYVGENVLCSVLMWIFFRKANPSVDWAPSLQLGRRLLAESRYELVSHLSLILLIRLAGMMVGWLCGDAEAGLFAAASRISEVTYFIAVVFSTYAFRPLLQLRESDASKYKLKFADYIAASCAVGVVFAMVQTLAAPWSMKLIAGGSFASGVIVLQFHAWATVPYFIGVARNQYLAAEGAVRSNAGSMIIAVAVHLALCVALVPQLGALGGAIATVLSYSVAWLGSSFFFTKQRESLQLLVTGLKRLPGLVRDFQLPTRG